MSKSSATDLTLDFYNSNTNLVKQYRKEKHLLYGTLLFGNIFSKYRRKKGPFLLFSDNYTHSIWPNRTAKSKHFLMEHSVVKILKTNL